MEDLVLSEVHMHKSTCSATAERVTSVFNVQQLDEDGDLDISRRPRKKAKMEEQEAEKNEAVAISIVHHMATTLKNVGLQLWKGAFLLCDFFIHFKHSFKECFALELGCGPGLAGIVLARWCNAHVYLTDAYRDVLHLTRVNADTNVRRAEGSLSIRLLDWKDRDNSSGDGSEADVFAWTPSDHKILDQTDVLIATDCIYDDQLTDALFETLGRILTGDKILYLTVEKRYNFSVDALDVVANGYKQFQSYLSIVHPAQTVGGKIQPQDGDVKASELWRQGRGRDVSENIKWPSRDEDDVAAAQAALKSSKRQGPNMFPALQVSADFPQYITGYERASDLEMWLIGSPQSPKD